MPPRPINLSLYRAQIIKWARINVTYDKIAKRLRNLHKIAVDKRTIKRRLQQQDIKIKTTTLDTPLLRVQIAILFRLSNTDKETLKDLTNIGYQISIWTITRIRKQIGLVRRINIFNKKAIDKQMFKVLQRELDNGRIAGYGRKHLHVYFRRQGHLVTQQLFSSPNVSKFPSYYQSFFANAFTHTQGLLVCNVTRSQSDRNPAPKTNDASQKGKIYYAQS